MADYIGDLLLDIVSISTNRSKDEFDSELIEAIANSIVNLRGVINPLVVTKTGYNPDGEEVYELVDGHLQYFSAKRAMELDQKLEMIRAFVVQPHQEPIFLQQISLLRSVSQSETNVTVVSIDYQKLNQEIAHHFSGQFTKLTGAIAQLGTQINDLKLGLTKTQPVAKKAKASKTKELPNLTPEELEKAKSFVKVVNHLSEQEIRSKLKHIKGSKKFLDNLIKNRQFSDINDMIIKTPYFTAKVCKSILQNWHG